MGIDNILVAGAGALGALYGHKFIQNRKTWFLAEGERKKRLEQDGITVNGMRYNIQCRDSRDTDALPDLIFIAVKYHDLPEVVRQIAGLVTEETLIVSVLNGIDSEEIIRQGTKKGKILLSVPLGMDAVREGSATIYTTEGKLFFGHFDSSTNQTDMDSVNRLLDECKIACEYTENIRHVMWYKFMINTGINQVSAILSANYRFMRENIYAREIMDRTMMEVIAIANAEGVDLSSSDLEKWYKILYSLGAEGKTSMCQDADAGRKTEVEMFSGKMIELGKKHNIDVTINKILYNLIKAKEDLAQSRRR